MEWTSARIAAFAIRAPVWSTSATWSSTIRHAYVLNFLGTATTAFRKDAVVGGLDDFIAVLLGVLAFLAALTWRIRAWYFAKHVLPPPGPNQRGLA